MTHTTFTRHRPNELHFELLSTSALNPWPGNVSSPRLQMMNSHLSQALPVADATDRRCFTGIEQKMGEYTFGVRIPRDATLIKTIHRYPKYASSGHIKENPETIILFEYDKHLGDGRYIKEVDYLSMPSYHSVHQDFGFRYHYINPIEQRMPKGYVLGQSPNISDQGNYQFGLETNVAMMSIPQIVEDGVVASESYCRRMTTTGIQTYVVSFGKNEFPLNLYGDFDQYKIFPDIGEYVNEQGILVALRRYEDSFSPVTMSRRAVQELDFKYDRCIYVQHGARIVDIHVHHDSRLRPNITRGKGPLTPKGMAEQPEGYWQREVSFYQQLFDEYKRLRAQNPKLQISPNLNRLLVEAQGMITNGPNHRLARTYRSSPIDEWRIEITIEYPIVPTIGFKISGLSGDKGVICTVLPDEDMPVDDAGNRAELVTDYISTIKRMNVSRVVEQYINACSRDVSVKIRQMLDQGQDRTSIDEYLLGYYRIVSPKMVEMVSEEGRVFDKHLQSIVDEGIHLWIPPDNEPEVMDILRQLRAHYPPVYGPVTYKGMSGEHVRTQTPILIGSMYIMLLEKIGKNWSGVSASKLNHFGVPSKLTARDRNMSPGRNQPIRFGESETRLFVSAVGGQATVELLDRSNNPTVRKKIFETLLRSEHPTAIDKIIDRQQYPAGNGRILSLTRHFSECAGWRFTQGHT